MAACCRNSSMSRPSRSRMGGNPARVEHRHPHHHAVEVVIGPPTDKLDPAALQHHAVVADVAAACIELCGRIGGYEARTRVGRETTARSAAR